MYALSGRTGGVVDYAGKHSFIVYYFISFGLFLNSGWLVSVRVLHYSPKRTMVDIAEVFLWLMALGTILSASFWSAWTAKESAQEHYRRLKVSNSRSLVRCTILLYLHLQNIMISMDIVVC